MAEQGIPSPNPVYIVTGASRGYGLAIIRQLYSLSPHCHIVGTARSQDQLISVGNSFSSTQWDHVVGDITQLSIAQTCIDKAITRWGRLDGIVHNAGVLEPMGPISTIPISEYRYLMEVNVTAVLQLTQLALPYLRKSPLGTGRILLISSGAANRPYQGWAPYCMSKIALNMLGQVLAVEEPNIVTCMIRPGVLDTDMQQLIRDRGSNCLPSDMYDYFNNLFNEGNLVPPQQSAYVAANLLLYAPKHLSGQFLDWQDEKLNELQSS